MSADDVKRDAKNLANDAESEANKAKKKGKNFLNDIPEDYKKAALVVAGVALVVVGAKAINDRNNSTEREAKNSVGKAKNKVKDIFNK
mmetsp:Transcript_13464/g.40730  ORF Transcript_13464/g.40730 Transcript_13464/m.40730 type:complete len:88 (-) Transcript_13464:1542-1805(-)|eukprot:CAMPEP_0206134756 /NCGR_PEP_ID=MMETSP1473-20131121/190_1 /ASSEMBLY_ACC=CAM_ASM_001109 /TAXON_ID=1461547 /ORGANISM="Stichococcus sp, Strain RCC1054" /LENGTH=87 /DNA_ID=CAMNT_0053526377 /DNA_START=80 /DNA_END=343 /DNA_ORIENTATION=-